MTRVAGHRVKKTLFTYFLFSVKFLFSLLTIPNILADLGDWLLKLKYSGYWSRSGREGQRLLKQFGVSLTWGSDLSVGLGRRFLLLWCPLALNCSTERCIRGDISSEVTISSDNLATSAFHRLCVELSAVPLAPLIDPCRHQCPMGSFSTFKSLDRSLTSMLFKSDGSQRSRM